MTFSSVISDGILFLGSSLHLKHTVLPALIPSRPKQLFPLDAFGILRRSFSSVSVLDINDSCPTDVSGLVRFKIFSFLASLSYWHYCSFSHLAILGLPWYYLADVLSPGTFYRGITNRLLGVRFCISEMVTRCLAFLVYLETFTSRATEGMKQVVIVIAVKIKQSHFCRWPNFPA